MCLNCLVSPRSVASYSMANQNVSQIVLFCPLITIAIFQFGTLSYAGLGFGLYCTQWRIGWSLMNSIGSPTGKQHIFVTIHLVMIICCFYHIYADCWSNEQGSQPDLCRSHSGCTESCTGGKPRGNSHYIYIILPLLLPHHLLHLFLIFFLLLKMFPYAPIWNLTRMCHWSGSMTTIWWR